MENFLNWFTSEHVLQLAYLIGLGIASLFSGVAAYLSKQANKGVNSVNDAVNHRHLRADKDGNTPPKLYDAILHLHEKTDQIDNKADEILLWKRGYDGGPLDNGTKVERFIEGYKHLAEEVRQLRFRCNKPCTHEDEHGQLRDE